MAKQFKMFDTTAKGYVTFDDLISAAKSWNLNPTPAVQEMIKKSWVKAENQKSGVIEYYDFVNKILPSDFNNPADVMRVFKQKMEDNWAHVAEGFMKMDTDRSGKVDRHEIMLALDKLNIYVPEKVAKVRHVLQRCDPEQSSQHPQTAEDTSFLLLNAYHRASWT